MISILTKATVIIMDKMLFRHELKYMINCANKELLARRLLEVMKPDENAAGGFYKIRSVYFDDYWNTAYNDKMAGVQNRKKYRIRFYNYNDSEIMLECKIKRGNHIYKRSAKLTRLETDCLMNGEYAFLLKKNDELYKELYYQLVSRMLRPCCIVDYEREPYVLAAGDVRITFDHDIRSVALFRDVFNPDLPSIYVLEPGKIVMEVKFTEFLPSVIKKMLPIPSGDNQAFSKFTSCYERAAVFYPQMKKFI